ncbi:MAG: bactofilin family protein [Polyangiaceae bacterium]
MAANVTIIGRGARVRGRIVSSSPANGAAGDLEVLGFVEGEIAIGGDVTIDATGIVGASVTGRKVVVRGAVKGDLTAEEAVLLEEGARVAGDVKAPRVAIAPGALVRGYVETGQTGHSQPRAVSRPQAAAAPRQAPQQAAKPQAPATKAAAPHAAPAMRLAGASSGSAARGARRPPPPIVPVLKKAKGQIASKKKER